MAPLPQCCLTSLEQAEEEETSVSPTAMTLATATDSTDKVPVVKAKATHVLMSSLITSKHLSLSGQSEVGVEKPRVSTASCRWFVDRAVPVSVPKLCFSKSFARHQAS